VRPDDLGKSQNHKIKVFDNTLLFSDNKVKNDEVKIEFKENENNAKVTFLKEKSANGSGIRSPGPLVIRYDIDREQQPAGEILVITTNLYFRQILIKDDAHFILASGRIFCPLYDSR
jgi:hypothetical protein